MDDTSDKAMSPTPFQRFEQLTKRLLAVPKQEIEHRDRQVPSMPSGDQQNKHHMPSDEKMTIPKKHRCDKVTYEV